MKLQRLFENSHFVIVDKPACSLSVPSRLGAKDSRPCVGIILQTEIGHPIFPTHRLDYEVSGILLFAKNGDAQKVANDSFERRTIQKTYYALSEGNIADAKKYSDGTEWQCRLLRGKKRAYESPHGKESLTLAQCIGTKNNYLRWKLEPKTGRSHQLRYEMYRHGFPIVGDQLYGAKSLCVLGTEGSRPEGTEAGKKCAISLVAAAISFKEKEFINLGLPEKIALDNNGIESKFYFCL